MKHFGAYGWRVLPRPHHGYTLLVNKPAATLERTTELMERVIADAKYIRQSPTEFFPDVKMNETPGYYVLPAEHDKSNFPEMTVIMLTTTARGVPSLSVEISG